MNQELKDEILKWAGWFGLSVTAVWIVLKAIGIIHSPDWVQMLPYAGAIFTAGIGFQTLLDLKQRVGNLEKEQKTTDKRLLTIELKLN